MKNISKLRRIDTWKSAYYNKDKLTREGLRLGSRMGVGYDQEFLCPWG